MFCPGLLNIKPCQWHDSSSCSVPPIGEVSYQIHSYPTASTPYPSQSTLSLKLQTPSYIPPFKAWPPATLAQLQASTSLGSNNSSAYTFIIHQPLLIPVVLNFTFGSQELASEGDSSNTSTTWPSTSYTLWRNPSAHSLSLHKRHHTTVCHWKLQVEKSITTCSNADIPHPHPHCHSSHCSPLSI